ncbi:MAG: sensor histidine kinase [Chloroflexia bacterium]
MERKEIFPSLEFFMRVRWGALLLSALLGLGVALVGKIGGKALWPALLILAWAIAYSLLLHPLLRRLRERRAFLLLARWLIPLVDATAAVLLCHLTGGVLSPYTLLLLLHIVIVSFGLGLLPACVEAAWAVLLYGVMIGLEATEIFPPVYPLVSGSVLWGLLYRRPESIAASFLAVAGLFLVGAVVGGYVSQRLERQQSEIARLYQASQREAHKMRLVNELSRSLSAILEGPTLLSRIFTQLQAVASFDYAGLYLYDERNDRLSLVATWGFSDQEAREAEATAMERHPGWVLRHRQTLCSPDTEADPRVRYTGNRHSSSVLMVPLLYQERCLGVLGLGSKKKAAFGDEEQDLLEGVARQLAVALANARLYEESRKTLEELRQAQEKLVRSGRLAAIGELLSGLAHELNNPLSIILGNIQLALEIPNLDAEARKSLEAIGEAGERIARLVHLLGDLELLREERFEAVEVRPLVEEALSLVQDRVEHQGTVVEVEIGRPLPAIWGSRPRLLQVLRDLLVNALEAMEGQERPKRLSITGRVEDGDVLLSIQDTGRGIPAGRLAHVFEPGFSTKVEEGRARGLGLGLFVAYHTIRAHGGEMALVSQEGGGTLVTIRLPVAP